MFKNKKLLIYFVGCILIGCIFPFCIRSCTGQPSYIKVEYKEKSNNNTLETRDLIEIGKGLVYDSYTKIVYMEIWIPSYMYSDTKTYCPYYAPNGLPFRYNTETNTLEEIQNTN